jgi:2-oxoglutarate ferredoxin oxidoreductase subunit beta
MPVYADFCTMHCTHGRALPFATGLKLARPNMKVIVVMGDGDSVGIGGNHFLHACRRDIDLTAVIVNNSTYGMTGGQCSPTTPTSAKATTAPYGNIDRPLDIAEVAKAAGASFVARGTTYHAFELMRYLDTAFRNNGMSVVEVLSQCPVHFGKLNNMASPVDLLAWQRDNSALVGSSEASGDSGKIARGVLVDRKSSGFIARYDHLVVEATQKECIK